jgi:hypothetical protein
VRRLLAVAVLGGAFAVAVPASPASANHNCPDIAELVCFATCPSPKICPWP